VPSRSVKIQNFLSNLLLFKELGTEEINRIATGTREVRIDSGATLFTKGDPCSGFYMIVYGQIKLAIPAANGSEKVVEIMRDGQSFGEAIMFLEKPYIVSAQALADSLLLHISKATVFDELERDPRFARRVIAGLSARLHHLVRDVGSYALQSGRERVVGYLLHNETGRDGEAGGLTLSTKKGIIASRLNLTQEHFSRILHELVAEKLIEVRGREITIPDIGRLRGHGNLDAQAEALALPANAKRAT
jgi:CRP-like cAMP-binding protein